MSDKVRTAAEPITEIPITNPQANHATEPIDNLHLSEGIPTDMLKLFEIDLLTTTPDALNKLREIAQWAFDGQTFIGDGMMKLKTFIENMPTQMNNKYEHVWNMIALQKRIDAKRAEVEDLELRKQALYSMGADHRRPY